MGAHIAQFGGDAVDFLRKQRGIAFHRHLVEPNVAGKLLKKVNSLPKHGWLLNGHVKLPVKRVVLKLVIYQVS